jgi:formylglycine-generating enzyme required for sulfatase activity
VDLADSTQWWRWVPGANWRQPLGPGSSIAALGDHPEVHVADEDIEAYATWAGKTLPTEAEWEFAARGGLDGADFTWGSEDVQFSEPAANTWQGDFPWRNDRIDGWVRTSPVGSFAANGYGLFDMAGNVWEWTADWYADRHGAVETVAVSCCMPKNPRGGQMEGSFDPRQPQVRVPRKVVKGGSHLCAPSYCYRYRPAARQPQMIDTGMCHLGFRCIVRGKGS